MRWGMRGRWGMVEMVEMVEIAIAPGAGSVVPDRAVQQTTRQYGKSRQ